MAVTRRYDKKWYIRFEVNGLEVKMPTEAKLKSEAQMIEASMKKALKTNDYDGLDQQTRTLLVRYFTNREMPVPEALIPQEKPHTRPVLEEDVLTLTVAARMACTDPETQSKNTAYRQRFGECVVHLLSILGADTAVETIRVSDIKRYMLERENQGAAAATINRERGALSKIFRILIENELIERNPVSLTKPADEKRGRRKVYLSYNDFMRLVTALPDWYKPIALMAYYTGMRQGEIRTLKRSSLHLDRRLIRLNPTDTKERNWKTVPLHKDLIPILKRVLSKSVVSMDAVFLRQGRSIPRTELRRLWEKAVAECGIDGLHFHDLRHTWKTNARRSGIDEELRSKIMGHSHRAGSTHEGYGVEFDQEYLDAIDKMTFDHGETTIWAEKKGKNCRLLPNLRKAQSR